MTPLTPPHPHGSELARWARDCIRQELGGPAAIPPTGAWCDAPGATFVTIHWRDGQLQGCIGSLVPRRSILADVAENAVAAATRDPRSRPLVSPPEVDDLDLDLSILSPQEPIAFIDEASAHAAIRPGVDGIVLGWNGLKATFLPSMWPRLPDVRTFLGELKLKAGLPRDFWDDDVKLWRYTVDQHTDTGAL
jgi:AmmeMemoRadiSam system protein A